MATNPTAKAPETNRAPDYDGQWRVWLMPEIRPLVKPDHAACLGTWLIDAPGVHAFWRCWRVSLIHLRDIEGVPPAKKTAFDSTHEIISQALHPDHAPSTEDVRMHVPLFPMDFAVQASARDDATALRAVHALLTAVSKGELHPDSDYANVWAGAFLNTARCISAGNHPQS